MEEINRETIKWCQAFFDEGQATINMPFRHQGLYQAWRQLIPFDKRLPHINTQWLANLSLSAEQTIAECMAKLSIPYEHRSLFLTLLLTTLPGWASYVKYRTEWAQNDIIHCHPVTQADYLAMRIVLVCIIWPEASQLMTWHQQANSRFTSQLITKIVNAERRYQDSLLNELFQQIPNIYPRNQHTPLAQLVFCIDVRSEPFRRALEAQGNYETFGFAGFFGIPTQIKNKLTEECYSSCPVLLIPQHTVKETFLCSDETARKISEGIKRITTVKRLYQALKYNFTTPFALVEILGFWSGLCMLLRTITPLYSTRWKQKILKLLQPLSTKRPLLIPEEGASGIDIKDQCAYAESALRMMGLTDNFSPLIVLCGHGSLTQNNAYASALDCGACGGNQGDANARILATILNDLDVRAYLAKKGIIIQSKTRFIAALHNTTTDEVTLYPNDNINMKKELNTLMRDLEVARETNNHWRCQQMGYDGCRQNKKTCIAQLNKRSTDWAQTRPEWGLGRNAAFIIGPRNLTKNIDLEGRAFLHSYNWQQDKDGSSLTTILTAPMVVAQWINNQYLFSSLDNVAYGSGSKITHNITGKIGVMQGNGSDLMHGLPLQSIYINETKAYHEPLRLMSVVYAPRSFISDIISHQAILQKLFSHGWVELVCIEPNDGSIYYLKRDLTWKKDNTIYPMS